MLIDNIILSIKGLFKFLKRFSYIYCSLYIIQLKHTEFTEMTLLFTVLYAYFIMVFFNKSNIWSCMVAQ